MALTHFPQVHFLELSEMRRVARITPPVTKYGERGEWLIEVESIASLLPLWWERLWMLP